MLLTHKEHLELNLGSSQLIEILDNFLYKSIEYIFTQAPDFSLQWVCDMLCMINTTPHKRKFSVNMDNDSLTKVFSQILVCKIKDRLSTLKKAALDRVYLVTLVSTFLSLANRALPECDPELLSDNRNIERLQLISLLGMSIWTIEPTVNDITLYSRLTHTFLSYISEKYEKLCLIRTRAMMKGHGLHISEKDLYMNNSMMIIRAIYKYSAEQGTLTNFIVLWMRSNNSPRFAHEYDVAYELPQSKRNALSKHGWEDTGGAVMNLAVPLEDAADVASDLCGSILTVKEDSAGLQLMYKAATMLKDDDDVVFYMKSAGFPDKTDQLVCYKTAIRKDLLGCVNYLIDLQVLDGPAKPMSNGMNCW